MAVDSSTSWPDQPTLDPKSVEIPDPWFTSDYSQASVSPRWPLPAEPHPLIAPAGQPDAPRISASTVSGSLSPVQMLP